MQETVVIQGNSEELDKIITILKDNILNIKIFKANQEAFGILKNRIKDPVAWQSKIREENDRDIYKDFKN